MTAKKVAAAAKPVIAEARAEIAKAEAWSLKHTYAACGICFAAGVFIGGLFF